MILTVPVDREFYPTLGPLICEWAEQNLVFGPGDLRGQPYVFDDEKRALVYRMYEVYPKGHDLAGRRRFRKVGLSLPKGLAKTELAAVIAACELHHDSPVRCVGWTRGGEPLGGPVTDPYIPMVAYTEEQSDELCYGALRIMLEEGPLRDDFDIGLERILRKGGDGRCVSLATSPNARDGARTTFAVADETHWWTLARLKQAYQTITNNLAKRKLADPWMLETTTAPAPGAGSVAEATMDYAKAVQAGTITDSTLFFFHRQASDEHDLTTKEGARAAVIEASGPAAAWRDIDGIVAIWADPSTDRTYWERVWCNRLVQQASQAFDIVIWRKLAVPESPVKDGDAITIGFDGSMFHDATGVVPTHVLTGYQWVAGVWERPPMVDDWRVPEEEVDAVITDLFTRFRVLRMYADPPYWNVWVSAWIARYGKDRVHEWWTNRRRQMSAALEGFDTAIRAGSVHHGRDLHLERHLSNARKLNLTQRDENGKPYWLIQKDRPNSPNKMDLAMCAVLSWEARSDAIAAGALDPEPRYEVMIFGGGKR